MVPVQILTREIDAEALDIDAPFSIRVSKRAKHVSFNVSRWGLEIVVPRRFNRRQLPDLIAGQRAWIDRALDRVRVKSGGFSVLSTPTLPTVLELRAANESVAVDYSERPISKARLRKRGNSVHIEHPAESPQLVFDALRKYLKQRARQYFISRLARLSEFSGLPYARICVRGQRGRWGSYSSAGVVNLNFKLLFLPPELVEHVLLHELCHSKHMNHSPRFWALLKSLDADTESHRRALRDGDSFIPDWVDTRR